MERTLAIDLREHNTILVGYHRYFVLRSHGQAHLVRDLCPHRGGPLSLGRLTPDGRRLTCPWHGTRVGVAALHRTALPMVRSGDRATVVLADIDGDTPISLAQRVILANLPPAGEEIERDAGAYQAGPMGMSTDQDARPHPVRPDTTRA